MFARPAHHPFAFEINEPKLSSTKHPRGQVTRYRYQLVFIQAGRIYRHNIL